MFSFVGFLHSQLMKAQILVFLLYLLYPNSLSELVRWLGTKAEELGVEIYPGFAASEVRISSHNQFFPLMLCRQNHCKQGICHVSDTYFCQGAL
jgi:hypothetical protein